MAGFIHSIPWLIPPPILFHSMTIPSLFGMAETLFQPALSGLLSEPPAEPSQVVAISLTDGVRLVVLVMRKVTTPQLRWALLQPTTTPSESSFEKLPSSRPKLILAPWLSNWLKVCSTVWAGFVEVSVLGCMTTSWLPLLSTPG